jgi:hypothetical protein
MSDTAHLFDLFALATSMGDEIRESTGLLVASQSSQFARRTLIRTAFACVEAYISIERRLLLESEALGVIKLDQPLQAVLRGESYDIQDDGQVHVGVARFPRGRRMLRFVLVTTATAYGLVPAPDFGTRGWQALVEAWAVRNRLTHPRTAADLVVSDSELQAVNEGYLWFSDTSIRMRVAAAEILEAHVTRLRLTLGSTGLATLAG